MVHSQKLKPVNLRVIPDFLFLLSALFWEGGGDFTQRRMLVHYRRFGPPCRLHLQGRLLAKTKYGRTLVKVPLVQ
jgi:hypothetical protein